MEHPKDVGDRTTLAVISALREAGYALFLPFGENTRADLIIELGTRLARVQCKTGRLRKGAVRFATCSAYGHHRNPAMSRRDYHGEVDYFAIYCPETTGIYLVPIEALPVRVQAALRVDPCLNNQRRHIRWASDFEIGRVAVRVTAGLAASAGGSAPSA